MNVEDELSSVSSVNAFHYWPRPCVDFRAVSSISEVNVQHNFESAR